MSRESPLDHDIVDESLYLTDKIINEVNKNRFLSSPKKDVDERIVYSPFRQRKDSESDLKGIEENTNKIINLLLHMDDPVINMKLQEEEEFHRYYEDVSNVKTWIINNKIDMNEDDFVIFKNNDYKVVSHNEIDNCDKVFFYEQLHQTLKISEFRIDGDHYHVESFISKTIFCDELENKEVIKRKMMVDTGATLCAIQEASFGKHITRAPFYLANNDKVFKNVSYLFLNIPEVFQGSVKFVLESSNLLGMNVLKKVNMQICNNILTLNP